MQPTNLNQWMRLAFAVIIATAVSQGLSNDLSKAALTLPKASADIPSGKPDAMIDLATA